MATINTAVTVTPGTVLATATPKSFGMNFATWDSDMLKSTTTGQLAKTPCTLFRFPGGSTSDFYHWAGSTYKTSGGAINPSADPTQHTATGTTGPNQNGNPLAFPNQPQFAMGIQYNIDDFMKNVVMPMGNSSQVQVMFAANYGSNLDGTAGGDPLEAASFAAYMNTHYSGYLAGIEIGNETYGSLGMYSNSGWEFNTRPMAQRTPNQYATDYALFRAAIKAAVPACRVAPVLTAPGNWPDQATVAPGAPGNSGNYTLGGNPATWNQIVLAANGASIDFAVIHVYPQGPLSGAQVGQHGEDDAALLSSAVTATAYSPSVTYMSGNDPNNNMTNNLGMKQLLATYCASNPLGAANVPWFVSETNSCSYNPGKQTASPVDAVWLVDWFATWIENGCTGVCWWAFRNGNSDVAGGQHPNLGAPTTPGAVTLYGPSVDYGDYGVVAYPNAPVPLDYPPAGTPTPAAHGFEILRALVRSGDRFVRAQADQALCRTHAALGADGSLRILLNNADTSGNSFQATVNLGGFAATPNVGGYTYGGSQTPNIVVNPVTATVSGGTISYTVVPYTTTVLIVQPSGTAVIGSGGGPSVVMSLVSTTISASTINPGNTVIFTPTLSTDTNVTNTSVRLTVVAPDGTQIALTPVTQNLNANVPTAIPVTWTVPLTQVPGVGYKLTVADYPSGSTTPYLSVDSGQTFTVNLPQNKLQPIASPGASVLVPDGIPIPNLTDPALKGTLVQAAVTVNSGDGNATHVAPLIGVVGQDGIALTPNRESTQVSLFNGFAQGLFSVATTRPFVYLYALDPLTGTVRTATGDTGWQSTVGLQWAAAKIVTQSLNGQNGSYGLQYFLDLRLPSGDFITVWQSNPYNSQILSNNPQADYVYTGPPLQAGSQGFTGSMQRAMPLTDFARIRWVFVSQVGTTNLTSNSSISFYGS